MYSIIKNILPTCADTVLIKHHHDGIDVKLKLVLLKCTPVRVLKSA